ncbi:sugar transporter domain-containing protein [Phthorimaea operculella]|nr:sugar transporter domain-containing protein [Phthorimaea operculella]
MMTDKKISEVESAKPQDEKPKTDLVMVLTKEIGEFGLYQFRFIALAALVGIFVAWSTNQFLFTAARIDTRCFVQNCDVPGQEEFLPPWIDNAIPRNEDNNFDMCHKFLRVNNTYVTNDTCPATLFDRGTTVQCETFVYENTDTVVYDYDLACDEWRRTLIGTIRTVGTLLALPITGYISDRWGRRTAMVIHVLIAAFVGTLRVFANTYVGFVISQFFEASGFGAMSCAYIMSMEIVGTRFRVAAAASMSSSFAIGQVTLAAIAWGLPYWKHLTLALYLPQLIVIAYLWLMPENYRWYLSKGRYEDAEKVLKDAARVNKKAISESSLTVLRNVAEENRLKMQNKEKEPWLVALVFQNKPILIRCIASPIWWISTMAVYYGLTINAVHLAGNSYQNFMLVAAVEIPGFWLAVVLMNRIGRRPVLIGGFWVCAACMIASIFVSTDSTELYLTLYLIGKCSISTVMVSIHLYTAELYPTKHRHSLFAFSSMMGRLGHIVAPLTPAFSEEIWVNLPYALFAVLALVSGALVFLTPETLGANLPDTMEQAVDIGRKRKK